MYLNTQPIKVIKHPTIFSDANQVTQMNEEAIDALAVQFASTILQKCIEENDTSLNLANVRIKTLPNIPPHVKYLHLNSTKIEQIIDSLPNIHALSVAFTPLEYIKAFPSTLLKLQVHHTHLKTVPPLPPKLLLLHANSTGITRLPKLPSTLQELWVNNTHITELPDLPQTLEILWVYNTLLEVLPPLPDTLIALQTHNTKIMQRDTNESMRDYIARVNLHYTRERCIQRLRVVKEELMTRAWHPSRVSKWLERMDEHSFDILIGEQH